MARPVELSHQDGFTRNDLAPTWLQQYHKWVAEASRAGVPLPPDVVLATSGTDGQPSTRGMRVFDVDERGLVLLTSHRSAKARDLAGTPRASVTFPWFAIGRQVNMRGPVERVSRDERVHFWRLRTRGHQSGIWASDQSAVIASRDALSAARRAVDERFEDVADIPPPPNWDGWRLSPDVVEFWQRGLDALHDRLRYRRDGDVWRIERLSP